MCQYTLSVVIGQRLGTTFWRRGKDSNGGTTWSCRPFERDTDDWTAYCERLQQFFVANEIKEDGKKRAVLLSVCGTASYQLIRSLVAPSKPTDKSVDEIMKLVKDHLTPQPSSMCNGLNLILVLSRIQRPCLSLWRS